MGPQEILGKNLRSFLPAVSDLIQVVAPFFRGPQRPVSPFHAIYCNKPPGNFISLSGDAAAPTRARESFEGEALREAVIIYVGSQPLPAW